MDVALIRRDIAAPASSAWRECQIRPPSVRLPCRWQGRRWPAGACTGSARHRGVREPDGSFNSVTSEVAEGSLSAGMKKRSLFLVASVLGGIANGLLPSARADDCTDVEAKTTQAGPYTCIAGMFREGETMPPSWRGNPCAAGDTFYGRVTSNICTCVGGQYQVTGKWSTLPPGATLSPPPP